MEFLEKALNALSSEELMLLTNKATTHMYHRLNTMQIENNEMQQDFHMYTKRKM